MVGPLFGGDAELDSGDVCSTLQTAYVMAVPELAGLEVSCSGQPHTTATITFAGAPPSVSETGVYVGRAYYRGECATEAPTATGTGPGFAVGSMCYRSPDAAVAAMCASVSGSTANGVASCSGGRISGGAFRYTLLVEGGAGQQAREVIAPLIACEPQDMAVFGPWIATAFTACVMVLAAGMLAQQFKRETL